MPEQTVGIKLSLKDRRAVAKGLKETAEDVEKIGTKAVKAGRRALTGARGFAALADRKITTGIRSLSGAVGGLGASLAKRGLAAGATAGALAVGGLVTGLGVLAVTSVRAASGASETGAAFATVFGDAAGAANSWNKQLSKSSGLAVSTLQQAQVGFGGLGKQVGLSGDKLATFSSDLTQAGLDLSSFWNTSSEDALAALQSGLTGEAEPLKRYGIFMSDASLNAFALTKGITATTQEMSEQQKIALRQAFIMENLGDAQGDLARTGGGLANQTKGLTGRFTTLQEKIGKALTPAALGLVTALNTGLGDATGALDTKVGWLTGHAGLLGEAFVDLGAKVPGAIASFTAGGGMEVARDRLGEVAGVLGAVTSGFADMPVSPLQIAGDALSIMASNTGLVHDAVSVALPVWAAYKTALVLATVWSAAFALGEWLAAPATLAFAGSVWALTAAFLANPITWVVVGIAALVAGFVLAYKKVDWFRGAVDAVLKKLKDLWGWTKKVGGGIANFFGRGGAGTAENPAGPIDLEARAKGGPVRANTPYLVGERGVPEVVVPHASGTVVPSVQEYAEDYGMAGMDDLPAAGPSSTTVQLVVDRQVLSEAVLKGFRAQLARQG